ncbi:MAG: ABC transporter ATP-binding protein [Desulfotomaculum sp.]|nr:ABC transporter ATP-binding protein [Desulfotomaculum sp.]MCL0081367.1 ABC transporter ATP-binding protein [Peptococcaceae bacterium]
MAILVINEVSKSFGSLQVLKKISLEVQAGTITGLVGPNGSGKSTLLSTVFGLHKIDGGSVYFQDQPVTGLPPHRMYQKGIAFSFQIPRLFFQLTVLDNLLMAAREHIGTKFYGALFLRHRWQQQETQLVKKAGEILKMLNLFKLVNHKAGELSGGQRKLLEIGRVLMSDPAMIFLDEPAAGVNPVLSREIYQKLHLLCQKGLSILLVEHKLEMLLDFADYVYMMDSGQILLAGKPQAVISDPLFYQVYIGETKNAAVSS